MSTQYDKQVEKYILAYGLAMLPEEESNFGWENYDIYDHQTSNPNCSRGFKAKGELKLVENSVYIFVDTFTGKANELGLELHGNISCPCGEYTVDKVRIEGTLGSIIDKITKFTS